MLKLWLPELKPPGQIFFIQSTKSHGSVDPLRKHEVSVLWDVLCVKWFLEHGSVGSPAKLWGAELHLSSARLVGYRYIGHYVSVPSSRSDSLSDWQAEMSQLGEKNTQGPKERWNLALLWGVPQSGFWGWNPELGKPMQSPRSWILPPGAECCAERLMGFAIQPSTGFLSPPLLISCSRLAC